MGEPGRTPAERWPELARPDVGASEREDAEQYHEASRGADREQQRQGDADRDRQDVMDGATRPLGLVDGATPVVDLGGDDHRRELQERDDASHGAEPQLRSESDTEEQRRGGSRQRAAPPQEYGGHEEQQ